MSVSPSRKRRCENFGKDWEIQLGISVVGRSLQTKNPIHATCNFCTRFGKKHKEKTPTSQTHSENLTKTVKKKRKVDSSLFTLFTSPWRIDHIKAHMKNLHCEHWDTYQNLSLPEKSKYFDQILKHTIKNYLDVKSTPTTYLCNVTIINLIQEVLIDDGEPGFEINIDLSLNYNTCEDKSDKNL